MSGLSASLKKNWPWVAMVFFLAAFYSTFFTLGQLAKSDLALNDEIQQSQVDARQALKDREEIFLKNIQARPRLFQTLSLSLLIILIWGLALDIRFFARKFKKREDVAQGERLGPVSWGVRDVFHVFMLLFFVEAVLLTVEFFIGTLFHLNESHKDLLLMINSLIRDLIVAVFVIELVRRKYGQPLAELGLTARDFLKNVRVGLTGYLAVIPPLLATLFLMASAASFFHYEPPPQAVVQIYLRESSQHSLLFFTLFVAIVGPVIEEIFFRGFTFRVFRSRYGPRAGAVLSALLFSSLHMNLIAFLPIFLLGLFLAHLYERTGSLVPSMTAHIAHNLIMVLFTLGFKSFSS